MGNPTRYLFVCMANINRSVTGEKVFKEILEERNFKVGSLEEKTGSDFYVGSAGVKVDDLELDGRQYEDELGDSVDQIFAADWHVSLILSADYTTKMSKITDLKIGDFYDIKVPLDEFALRTVLHERLQKHVPERRPEAK